MLVPDPAPDDIPFNRPVSKRLDPGEQLQADYTPQTSPAEFYLPIVAASKEPEMAYEVRLDDRTVYGPAPVPPTDVDDMAPTFIPALKCDTKLSVVVTNLSTSGTTRTITVQPVGWEVSN